MRAGGSRSRKGETMPNPCEAFKGVKCDDCAEEVGEGEPLFMTDEGKLCRSCAHKGDYVCECGKFKKPQYGTCYACKP